MRARIEGERPQAHKWMHTCGSNTGENETCLINSRYIEVVLPPGTTLLLEIEMQRFVNDPSYKQPWQTLSSYHHWE
jgi:hypothetical protein